MSRQYTPPDRRIVRQAGILLACGIMLFLLGRLFETAQSVRWIPRGELAHFCHHLLFAAGFAVLLTVPFRFLQPPMSFQSSLRLVCGLLMMFVAVKVGSRYIHLCLAGSRVLEGTAFFGMPLLVGSALLASRGRLAIFVVSAVIILLVFLGARPYLDWAHANP